MDLPVTSQKETTSIFSSRSRVPKMEQGKCKSKGKGVSGHVLKLYGRVEYSCTYPYPRH